MKKYAPLAAAALLGASLLNASDEGRLRNLENRMTSFEDSQNNCCVINPPARPYPADCWGLYVTVDPLLWQGHVNGLSVATETQDNPNFFNMTSASHVKNLHFNWDWGFRLGLGLNTTHDAWDILVKWTYWHTDAHLHFSSGENNANYPRIGHPKTTGGQTPIEIHSQWRLHYNIVDLENGRAFYVSKFLSLRPFAGLRTGWIQQTFDTYNQNIPALNNPTAPNTEHNIFQSDHFWGIGPRAGVDVQWGLCGGWSLFSNYSGSLLYGYHKVKHQESGEAFDRSTPFSTHNSYHVGTGIFDAQLGVRFDWHSCDCCYHLGFDLGWEHHWHPGQNQFLFFTSSDMPGNFVANQGDLGIQGYFLRVRFDF